MAGAQESGFFRVVDCEPYLRLLRFRPRHRGNMAYELSGRFAFAFVADGYKCFAAVLYFYLARRSDRRFGQPAEAFYGTYLWLAASAGLLAICTWLHLVHPAVILGTVFLLGIGFAFNAPVWAAIIPEVVRKKELPSAITLGGVQMNMGGIVGPAIGGLLLQVAGPATLFSLNAMAFLFAARMISRLYRERRRPQADLENFLESLATPRVTFGTRRGCRSY